MTQAEIYQAVSPKLPKNFPFYDWVPKPLGIAFLVILFIPIMTVSGAYTVNSSEMVGGLGIQSEHIAFISFVTSIGMAAFSPFFYTLVSVRRQKMMSLVGFSILAVQSYICANTDSLFILALNSLIMGFVRQTLLMCNLFTLIKYGFGIEATRNVTPGNEPKDEAGWDALDTEKKASQPIIYFFFMLLGQIGTWITAWFAYNYHWQMVYYAMLGSILVALLITLLCMPYNPYPTKHSPLSFSKFGNVVVFCLMCCSFVYVTVYGKVYDWYDSSRICWATAICVASTLLFIYLEKTRRSPYFMLKAFKSRSIQGGILLFIGLMICNSSSMLVNIFVGVGMKTDQIQVAALGNWVLLGYFIGLVTILILNSKGVHFKWFFAMGFLLIGAASLFMYFEVQTDGHAGAHEVARRDTCYGHDAALLAHRRVCQPAHALQAALYVGVHHAHRAYGDSAGHRLGSLSGGVPVQTAVLCNTLRSRLRPHQRRDCQDLRYDGARNAVSGQERDRGAAHGCHVYKGQGAGAGYALSH